MANNFDPYSIYSDEDDVWYSEERLFEDHLNEIFNKWSLLDDDIWCKLIIMERNRRIGKAYARVPMVTIDGSHELSYDGYKLALNGFENPERDAKTDECRKRIGKGIRIKMDNYGNILIKRLSKANVFVKEWPPPLAGALPELSAAPAPAGSSKNRLMPSRRELIKNSSSSCYSSSAANSKGDSSGVSSSSCSSSSTSSSSGGVGCQARSSTNNNKATPNSSNSPNNDSSLCDELLQLGGRLELEKIYVVFDLKRFQANVEAELARPFPDKRKLERQCFSLVALGRDAHEMLNLPCWVMIINIVAIEMLNERFPEQPLANLGAYEHAYASRGAPVHLSSASSSSAASNGGGGDVGRRMASSKAPPSFVSIFEQPPTGRTGRQPTAATGATKEEDPYSLPANASSSDLKSSSLLAGGGASDQPMSRQQQHRHLRSVAPVAASNSALADQQHRRQDSLAALKRRSRSNGNIYGGRSGGHQRHPANGSIYSPGHMLVQPPVAANCDPSVPPKLPPRDFHRRPPGGPLPVRAARSVTNVAGAASSSSQPTGTETNNRKTKKNRFLESLRAPLELAKGASAATTIDNQSAADTGAASQPEPSKKPSKGLKSFLGVSSKSAKAAKTATPTSQKQQQAAPEKKPHPAPPPPPPQNDPNYHDLDIPTPDYDLELAGSGGYKCCSPPFGGRSSRQSSITTTKFKEDLYYSGFGAHVPRSSRAPDSGIYGFTSGGGRHRSASMQRSYASSSVALGGGPARSHTELYDVGHHPLSELHPSYGISAGPPDDYSESPYAMSSSEANSGGRRGRQPRPAFPSAGSLTALAGGPGSGLVEGGAGARRRFSSRLGVAGAPAARHHALASSGGGSVYDVGRSSSGIYGVNSSGSSSDYADWMPAGAGHHHLLAAPHSGQMSASSTGTSMRKVNSSGFLNSLFSPKSSATHNNNNNNNNNNNSKQLPAHRQHQQSHYASGHLLSSSQHSHLSTLPPPGSNRHAPFLYGTRQRSGKPASFLGGSSSSGAHHLPPSSYLSGGSSANGGVQRPTRPASALSKPSHTVSQSVAAHQGSSGGGVAGPNFRSYDSSNDSEPSYTNSSDGLDIYDHIGVYPTGRMASKFMGAPPEVHVGEWENMYNR